jgi:hypothetical protein
MHRLTRFLPLLAFSLCLSVLALRCRHRLLRAHLWAEDGSTFLKDAIEHGFGAIFDQYAGYFHVVPRLLAALFARHSLDSFALHVTLSCLVIFAASAALLARSSLRALLPDDALRVAGAVALCFLPGLEEILGNLANLHSALFLGAVLLSLKSLAVPLRPWELALLVIIGSSAGELVVLLPVFVLRAALRARRADPLSARIPEWTAAAIIAGWAVASALMWRRQAALGQFGEFARSSPEYYVQVALETFAFRFLVHPLVGDSGAVWVGARGGIFIILSVSLAAFLAWRLWRERGESTLLLLACAACLSGQILLTWYVRPGSEQTELFGRISTRDVFTHRYMWLATPTALLLWLVALQSLGLRRWRSAAALGLCVLVIATAWYKRKIGPYGFQTDWAGTVAQLRAIPAGQTGQVPINPEGWSIQVTGPIP